MKKYVATAVLLVSLIISGCTKSGSDDSDSGGGGEAGPGEYVTQCGVVVKGSLENPVAEEDGVSGVLKDVPSGNLVIIGTAEGELLVKLHALSSIPYDLNTAAVNFIRQNAGGTVKLFKSMEDCTVSVTGGTATSGQIITAQGRSLSEELIKQGFAQYFESSGTCGENLVASCYEALKESSAPDVNGSVERFLWKPKADGEVSKGRLVILTDVCDADIVVNGEHLVYDGPNNGYCSIGRAPKTGCAYGGNVRVEIFDRSDGGVYLFPDGKTYYTIPNGCSRVEFGN